MSLNFENVCCVSRCLSSFSFYYSVATNCKLEKRTVRLEQLGFCAEIFNFPYVDISFFLFKNSL
jgi:hypothetical protein